MPIPPFTRPPIPGFRDILAIDTVASEPVVIRARRSHGRLHHERLDLSPDADPLPALPAVTCLGTHESVVRRLHAPFAQTAKVRRVLPGLLDLRLPFPESECHYEFIDFMPSEQGGTQALAVAARKTTITRHLETCRTAGYDPLVLDQEIVALWTQSLLEIPPATNTHDSQVQLVIALYDDHATVGIGRRNHLLVTGNLGRDVVTDLKRRLATFEDGASPSDSVEIRWTGPGAAQRERLSDLIAAFEQIRTATHQIHDEPQTMLARALATRALCQGPDRCNLRLGTDTHPELQRRFRRRSLLSAGILGLCGLILFVLAAIWQRQIDRHDAALRHAVVEKAEAILGQPTPLRGPDAVDEVRRHVSGLRDETRPLGDLLDATISSQLDRIIQLAAENEILIHELQLEPDRMHLYGSALEWDAATTLHRALQSRLPSLTLDRQWDKETDDPRIHFDIRH